MVPQTLDLVWRRNAPEPETFTMTDGGVAVDLTGYTFEMDARLYPGAAGAAVFTLAMAAEGSPGFYLDDADAGEFTLTPPTAATLLALAPLPTATADVTLGRVVLAYDILLISGGVPEPFMAGTLTLDSGVTVL